MKVFKKFVIDPNLFVCGMLVAAFYLTGCAGSKSQLIDR